MWLTFFLLLTLIALYIYIYQNQKIIDLKNQVIAEKSKEILLLKTRNQILYTAQVIDDLGNTVDFTNKSEINISGSKLKQFVISVPPNVLTIRVSNNSSFTKSAMPNIRNMYAPNDESKICINMELIECRRESKGNVYLSLYAAFEPGTEQYVGSFKFNIN